MCFNILTTPRKQVFVVERPTVTEGGKIRNFLHVVFLSNLTPNYADYI
jgi:hypothetical protein